MVFTIIIFRLNDPNLKPNLIPNFHQNPSTGSPDEIKKKIIDIDRINGRPITCDKRAAHLISITISIEFQVYLSCIGFNDVFR